MPAMHPVTVLSGSRLGESAEYVAKKMAEGHTKMEAIRCLKRYIAREVYYTIKKQRELVNCS